tara:strand:- start:346 stop:585 length:240 start_codon:yes stop_codon:yes gene_type:complete
MLKKKSYMNKENILAEGFFSKLFKVLSLSKSDENKLKKSKKIRKSLFDLNNAQSNLEKSLEDLTGDKVSLNRYSLKDFI